jgi:hypothetical protein
MKLAPTRSFSSPVYCWWSGEAVRRLVRSTLGYLKPSEKFTELVALTA